MPTWVLGIRALVPYACIVSTLSTEPSVCLLEASALFKMEAWQCLVVKKTHLKGRRKDAYWSLHRDLNLSLTPGVWHPQAPMRGTLMHSHIHTCKIKQNVPLKIRRLLTGIFLWSKVSHTGFPGPNLLLLNPSRPGQCQEVREGIRSFVVSIIGVPWQPHVDWVPSLMIEQCFWSLSHLSSPHFCVFA